MNPADAKRIVLQYHERSKINVSWLATQINEHRQTVWNWLNGHREPTDMQAWSRMALALGLEARAASEILDTARELALDVLTLSDNPDLKQRAANLIREISKKYMTDR